jgi:hypothetical protein
MRAADAAPLTRAFRAYRGAAFGGHDMVDRCARNGAFNDPPFSSAERFLLLSSLAHGRPADRVAAGGPSAFWGRGASRFASRGVAAPAR